MKEYKVTKNDLIGAIKGFPIEIVQKMVERQVEQGNEADVTVFQIMYSSNKDIGGFAWDKTEEGRAFWCDVLDFKRLDVFFKKYPKKEVDAHVYYRGDAERGDEIISDLIKLGGINYYNISAENIDCYYFVDPKNKRINFLPSGGLYSHILDECYTEKFLPENKQETIEIDGKKYNKQEVLDRIKELK